MFVKLVVEEEVLNVISAYGAISSLPSTRQLMNTKEISLLGGDLKRHTEDIMVLFSTAGILYLGIMNYFIVKKPEQKITYKRR